jgi:sialate O-acetylesterase
LRIARSTIAIFFLTSIAATAQVIDLKGSWKFHIGDKSLWSSQEYDDSNWEYIKAPSAWEDQGFNGYDGFAWYRKKFDGRKLNKNEGYYLNLGFIDDTDEVYLNGKLIGFSGFMPPKFKTAYNSERIYTIPYEVINYSGENNIAIRVYDVTLGGGIIDGDLGIYRAEQNRLLIDLQGIWSFRTASSDEHIDKNDEWGSIIVPGPWEHQGYLKYDGFAWYKRTFNIPGNFTKEPLVLLAGKIDDFDKIYLNGQFIGSTNDHRPFGSSFSYRQLRVYNIPPLVLKKSGINTVEILVEDMGHMGGILEGPIGIISKANYEKYFKD